MDFQSCFKIGISKTKGFLEACSKMLIVHRKKMSWDKRSTNESLRDFAGTLIPKQALMRRNSVRAYCSPADYGLPDRKHSRSFIVPLLGDAR